MSRPDRNISSRMLLGVILLAAVVLPRGGVAGAAPPFADAHLAPPDTALYVHVMDGAAVRRDLAQRPLGEWLAGLLGGDAGAVWSNLARRMGVNEQELFDSWLGRSTTLITRPNGAGQTEWVLMAEPRDRQRAESMLRRMKPTSLPPRSDLPVLLLPDHHALVAQDGNVFIVGSRIRRGLFDETIDRRAGERGGATLADNELLARGRRLDGGEVEIFYRHGDELYAGASVIVARLEGGEIVLQHHAQFDDAPPFARPVTELRWNMAPLDAFERRALLAVIEPTDIGPGPLWRYLEQAVLEWPLVSEAVRRRLGDSRVVAVGEVEGRMESHATDMLVPAGVVALKIDGDERAAERDVDESMVALVRRLNTIGEGTFLIDLPVPATLPPGSARHVDLQPALSSLAGGFPIMKSVSLDWRVVAGANGSFIIVSSHPGQLEDTARALTEAPAAPARVGDWASCGTLNGPQLARQLESYADQARLFTRDGDPQQQQAVRETMRTLAGLAGGLDRCRWQLRRPCPQTMELDVRIMLRATPSAAGGDAEPSPSPRR